MNLLLNRNAEINAADANGWTPLDRADNLGHPNAVKFLKQRGGRSGTR